MADVKLATEEADPTHQSACADLHMCSDCKVHKITLKFFSEKLIIEIVLVIIHYLHSTDDVEHTDTVSLLTSR